jgi:hypothetical protein
MWLGWARFSTVLLKRTSSSSCSRLNVPVKGLSSVLMTTPSLTHCQNCVCVVQNSLRSRQITSAVFFFFFFFLSLLTLICLHYQLLKLLTHFRRVMRQGQPYASQRSDFSMHPDRPLAWHVLFISLISQQNGKHAVPRGEASIARRRQIFNTEFRIANFGFRISPYSETSYSTLIQTPKFHPDSSNPKSAIRNPKFLHISSRDINSARRFTPNLTKIFRKWNFTVCLVTSSRDPISALVNPSTQSNTTCTSR